jgi:hypothetical protein
MRYGNYGRTVRRGGLAGAMALVLMLWVVPWGAINAHAAETVA